MDNPGLKKGLAQSFGYDQMTADIARRQDQMRQAKVYAENQAKMLADDFDYNNAMNAWDNTQVKQFAQNKINELGKFIRENPDYKYNVQKRIIYNNIKKELKDNKALNEGLQVDSNIKQMQAYMNDPKNAPIVQSEDFKPILAQYENYIKTGSVDGNTANRKLFSFAPPEERVDTTPILMNYAQNVALNGKDMKWLARGVGSVHQFATNDDKAAAAEGAINDRVLGKYLQKEYNDYISNIGEGEKPINFKQYVVTKMSPYFKNDEYKNFNYATGDGGKSGSGSGSSGAVNRYAELIQRAQQASKKGGVAAIDAKGLDQIISGGKEVLNTNGLLFEVSPGNFVPFKGGLTKGYTTSNSVVKHDPATGEVKASVKVQMPKSDFEKYLDNADVFDNPTFGMSSIFGDTKIRGPFEKSGIQLSTDEDGNEVALFDLWVPLEKTNTNIAASYNHALGSKAEEVTSDFQAELVDTKTGSNGVTYQLYSDGTIVGSDGSVTKK